MASCAQYEPPSGRSDDIGLQEWSRFSSTDTIQDLRHSSDDFQSTDLLETQLPFKQACAPKSRPPAILEYLPSWLHPTYARIKERKTRSRFYGWKWGVLTGAITAGSALMINISFLAIAIGHRPNNGISTLFSGYRKRVVTANTAFHLLINICSTLLMSASTYATQVLTAPTRGSCDGAHKDHKSLDVGVLHFSNLRRLPIKHTLLCAALVVSSLPLHLFYNASVFQVVPILDKRLDVVNHTSPRWSEDYVSATLNTPFTKELSLRDLSDTAITDEVLKIELSIDQVKLQHFDTSVVPKVLQNEDKNKTLDDLSISNPLYYYTDRLDWPNLPGSDGWFRLRDDETHDQGWSDERTNAMLHVTRVIVHTRPNWYKVSVNIHLLTIVVISNAIKLAVLVFILLDAPIDQPLVTIGDAVASFMSQPDANTTAHRNFALDDFIFDSVDSHQQEKIDVSKILRNDKNVAGQWKPRRRRYGLNAKKHSALQSRSLMFANLSAWLFVGAAALVIIIPLGPWGPASTQRNNFPSGLDGTGYIALAMIINAPQLFLTTLYFTLNRVCTTIATVYEYNQFGVRKKALRVSRPEGVQKETYFLQLPLRFAIPLNTAGGLLHWLASQTLFLVRLDMIREDGSWDKSRSSAAWGVSGSAYLTLVILLWLLFLSVLGFANTTFTERVPFAGTSSWVISAACHPPPTDKNPALGEICWGRIEDDSESNGGAEEFSFSSSAVIVGLESEQATRQTRVFGVLASLRCRFSKKRPATNT